MAFDVARAATFDAVAKWKHDLDEKLFLPSGQPVPAILLANKVKEASHMILSTRNVIWTFFQGPPPPPIRNVTHFFPPWTNYSFTVSFISCGISFIFL